MSYSNYRITLDVRKTVASVQLNAKKGDTGRKIYISLSDGSSPCPIGEGCYAVFAGVKPDGTRLYNKTTIEDNTIIYSMTEQTTAVAGQVACEVKLFDAMSNLLTSPKLTILVDDVVIPDEEIVSKDEVTALAELIFDTTAVRDLANQAVTECNAATESANTAAKTANTAAENLEQMVVNIQDSAGKYSLVQSYEAEDAHWTSTNKHAQEVKSSAQLDEETGNFLTGAFAKNAIALNGKSQAKGYRSFASGTKTLALGDTSHTEGTETIAVGNHSHAEGTRTFAGGDMSHAQGFRTIAKGTASHVEGYETIANGSYQHVQGQFNIEDTANAYAHIVGNGSSDTARSNAHTIDWEGNGWFKGELRVGGTNYDDGSAISTKAYVDNLDTAMKTYVDKKRVTAGRLAGSTLGTAATAEGYKTSASGNYSHAEGFYTHASGDYSHAEGAQSGAEGEASHAEGSATKASGNGSHTEGISTTASGNYSHAEGSNTKAIGNNSHAEGWGSKAEGEQSHAEGEYTIAGKRSHAEGYHTQANGNSSHAEGYYAIAASANQHVQGKFNIQDTVNKYAHIVGNGTSETKRSNAHTLDWDGNGAFAGSISSVTGADYAEYFEWLDGNTNNEDRVGLVVTLDGEKIRLATPEDTYILGIVSGTACVIGDTAEWEWCGKYITDDFGRLVTESVEMFEEHIDPETKETVKISVGFKDIPITNPDYDKAREYISRENRPEWGIVGLFGKLYARDDGTCEVNKYAKVGHDGQLTASEEKTDMRVLRRVSDNVIRVLLM